jgi:hypothetical protein
MLQVVTYRTTFTNVDGSRTHIISHYLYYMYAYTRQIKSLRLLFWNESSFPVIVSSFRYSEL